MEPVAALDETEDVDTIELLVRLRSEVFEDGDEELALAMGRPIEQIEAWINGDEEPDEDAEMKIRGIADERL
ncbi:MAG: hypothetical protein PSX80_08980 [bacterium]|nr:hypothetical protein [bacterium]